MRLHSVMLLADSGQNQMSFCVSALQCVTFYKKLKLGSGGANFYPL